MYVDRTATATSTINGNAPARRSGALRMRWVPCPRPDGTTELVARWSR